MLQATGVSGGYGDIRVLWGVDVAVRDGYVTCVLGRNGAGKTSLLNAVAGFLPTISAQAISLGDQDIRGMAPYRRVRAGLGYVQENKQIFRQRTVEDNLLLGGYTLAGQRKRNAARQAALDKAYERFPMLAERRKTVAGSLSGGQQQMLAIAQALMPEPRLLMLDEPSAGLAPAVAKDVFAMVSALRETGLSILLVEQVVEAALEISDDVVVLDNGRVMASGPVSEFQDPAVIQAIYLGQEAVRGSIAGSS